MEAKLSESLYLATDLKPSEYVIVYSETFGECYGYVQGLFVPYGLPIPETYPPSVTVRLDLPDDHPAVLDALGDNPDWDVDLCEFIDIIPVSDLERTDGTPIRTWTRSITDRERAERARKRGLPRIPLPELDTGLRR